MASDASHPLCHKETEAQRSGPAFSLRCAALCRNHVSDEWREPQIPPLRSPGFPVEVGGVGEVHPALLEESRTRGSVRVCEVGNPVRSFENHDQASSRRGGEKSRSLHYAPPDFLLSFVTSANSMRLSLLKAAHAAVVEGCVAGNPGSLRSG